MARNRVRPRFPTSGVMPVRLPGQDLRRLLMLLGEQSEEGERLRTRSGSVAAVLLLVIGLLVALGYGRIVLGLLAAVAIVVAVVAAAMLRRERNVWAWLSARLRRPPPVLATLSARGRRRAGSIDWRAPAGRGRRLVATRLRRRPVWPQRPAATGVAEQEPTAEQAAWPARAEAAIDAGSPPLTAVARPRLRLEGLLPALERRIGQAGRTAGLPTATSRLSASERVANRLALSRNALGMQLRRVGEPAEAAEQHRTARARARCSRPPATAAAKRWRQTASRSRSQTPATNRPRWPRSNRHGRCWRALGDQEHEGKVLANIGNVKQRGGAADEAAELLQTALAKLEPETPAYRLVERQLRHAS